MKKYLLLILAAFLSCASNIEFIALDVFPSPYQNLGTVAGDGIMTIFALNLEYSEGRYLLETKWNYFSRTSEWVTDVLEPQWDTGELYHFRGKQSQLFFRDGKYQLIVYYKESMNTYILYENYFAEGEFDEILKY